MNVNIKSSNFLLALIFVVSILVLFGIIIWRQLGGEQALFAIIGHTAAWVEMVALFFFRKSPPKEGSKPSP